MHGCRRRKRNDITVRHSPLCVSIINEKRGKTEKLVAALAFLIEELHFTCEALGQKQLILVKGCAAALAEPTEKLTKVTKDKFQGIKSGESNILEILLEEAKEDIMRNVNECKRWRIRIIRSDGHC